MAKVEIGELSIFKCEKTLPVELPLSICISYCPNVSTTLITAMGCRQCLPLSVVQLKGKHCRKPHCRNGVVDTFRLGVPIKQDARIILNNVCIVKFTFTAP